MPVSKTQFPSPGPEGTALHCPLVPQSRCPLGRGAWKVPAPALDRCQRTARRLDFSHLHRVRAVLDLKAGSGEHPRGFYKYESESLFIDKEASIIGIGIVRISQNDDLWQVALMETPKHQQSGDIRERRFQLNPMQSTRN